MFRDERDCFDFIVRSRWPEEGFRCPSCHGSAAFSPSGRLVLVCARCKHIQSATAGTVMHRSRLPLRTWLLAAWLMVTDKRGISSIQLERQLGVSHEAAFGMLHKLRAAMVAPDREGLRGRVEVDETYIGGPEPGKGGRGALGKEMVIGAVEVREGTRAGKAVTRPGRLRLRQIDGATARNLLGFVRDSVDPGATVVTDGLLTYRVVKEHGYSHDVEMHTFHRPQSEVLKHLHLAFSNLKTWLRGTHHGAVSDKHLQAYLNEFAFRFNRRDNLNAAFQTVLGLTGKVARPTQDGLYATGPGRFVHPSPRRGP
jgi:transposase-like protein